MRTFTSPVTAPLVGEGKVSRRTAGAKCWVDLGGLPRCRALLSPRSPSWVGATPFLAMTKGRAMGKRPDGSAQPFDQLDVSLTDSELLTEMALTAELIIQVNEASLPLSQSQIDRLLGLGAAVRADGHDSSASSV